MYLNCFVLAFLFVPVALIAPDLKVTHFRFICSALNQFSLWFGKAVRPLKHVEVVPPPHAVLLTLSLNVNPNTMSRCHVIG